MIRVRTGYSFRIAAGSIEAVLSRLKAAEFVAAPITDRASAFGWVKWDKAAHKAGLKPVFGVELAVTDAPSAKKPIVDFWTFLALNDLTPLNAAIELASSQFRYQPLLTYTQALELPGVIKVAGNRSNLSLAAPENGPRADFFTLGPGTAPGYARRALAAGLAPIAASDNRYPSPEDRGFWEVLAGRDAERHSYAQHILSRQEWEASIEALGLDRKVVEQAWENSLSALERCNATFKKAELLKPVAPEGGLRAMCIEGAAALGVNLEDEVYAQRLDRELELIFKKQFEDYFYIVADMVNFARQQMLVGPARGSSCGSLVCYLLGITRVDPIPYGLIFERFIDITRPDLPDIDIDFSDQRRQLVFDYAVRKYGRERVARLGTVAMYQPRSALNEAGTALHVPKWLCNNVADSLIERSSGDSRALNTLEDTLQQMPAGRELLSKYPEMVVAAKMEGHPRHYSQHAAGIVLADKPIREYIAVDARTGSTHCDKKDAEALNLLKIDALGLTQLSVFEDALELAGLSRTHLESIPMDDPEAFEILNARKFAGIFQFNGIALQNITKQFKVTDFDDIVCITALGRPGPLTSGGAAEWVRRKTGSSPVTYPHPLFEPYLKETLGIVLYQETVMNVGREIGGLGWDQVTALRKAMSKSLGKEYFDQFGDPWKKGAIERGIPPGPALDKMWNDLTSFGAWAFNKSHSVAYGIISYQCCWLKAHYPLEFAAATLSHEGSADRQIALLRELSYEGYSYIPVDADISTDKWTVGVRDGEKVLVGPLHNVKGIGPSTVAATLAARARKEPLPEKVRKLLDNPKTDVDDLWPIASARKRLLPDPAERRIFTPQTRIKDIEAGSGKEVLLYCVLASINPRDQNEPIFVAKRGYEIKDGFTHSLNLQLKDDTDSVFGNVDRFKYPQLGKPIVDLGKPGKVLYAIKGTVPKGTFRMVKIENVRMIGEL